MPKMKTHKGLKKRIKITKSGKLKRRKAFASHLREKKSSSRKRTYQSPQDVSKSDRKRVHRLLGI